MVQDCLLEKKLSEQEGGPVFWSSSTHKQYIHQARSKAQVCLALPCLASPPASLSGCI